MAIKETIERQFKSIRNFKKKVVQHPNVPPGLKQSASRGLQVFEQFDERTSIWLEEEFHLPKGTFTTNQESKATSEVKKEALETLHQIEGGDEKNSKVLYCESPAPESRKLHSVVDLFPYLYSFLSGNGRRKITFTNKGEENATTFFVYGLLLLFRHWRIVDPVDVVQEFERVMASRTGTGNVRVQGFEVDDLVWLLENITVYSFNYKDYEIFRGTASELPISTLSIEYMQGEFAGYVFFDQGVSRLRSSSADMAVTRGSSIANAKARSEHKKSPPAFKELILDEGMIESMLDALAEKGIRVPPLKNTLVAFEKARKKISSR